MAGQEDKSYGLFARSGKRHFVWRLHDPGVTLGHGRIAWHEDGARHFVWRLHDPGVTLGHGRIAWHEDGARHEAKLADIVSVHLQSGGDWRDVIGQCDIGLHDGRVLHVSDANASGLRDEGQRAVYRDFLRDLHARLGGHRVSLTAGYSPGRYYVVLVCAILLGLIFVAVPLVLLMITGETNALFLLFVGAMLALPLARMVKANAPRPYTPDDPPEELMG